MLSPARNVSTAPDWRAISCRAPTSDRITVRPVEAASSWFQRHEIGDGGCLAGHDEQIDQPVIPQHVLVGDTTGEEHVLDPRGLDALAQSGQIRPVPDQQQAQRSVRDGGCEVVSVDQGVDALIRSIHWYQP